MSEKQWIPLTTAEAVIEAIKAGRRVEFTACGCDYQARDGGWIEAEEYGLYDSREMLRKGAKYRAMMASTQPAADELRGGGVAPSGAVSAAAQKIAERVPLPETVGNIDVDKSGAEIRFARPAHRGRFGMRAAMRELPIGSHDLVTAESARAAMVAVAAEALRGAEAVGTVTRINFTKGEATIKYAGDSAFPPFDVGHSVFTSPPAGSVEVTDAMVQRAIRKLPSPLPPDSDWAQGYTDAVLLVREEMRAALTAALQEPEA